jgi:putative ABC transport system permease protein
VIGSNVAKKLNLGNSFIGSHGVSESLHQHEDFKYLVVGVLKPTGEIIDELIITPLESIWNVHHDEYKKGSFDLKTPEEHDLHQSEDEAEHSSHKKEITALLVNYNSPRAKFSIPGIINKKNSLMSADPAIEIKQLIDLIQPAVNILYFLALFIFGLSLFSIIITLVNSMKDRKYEIVMMRVGGASVKIIFISVILEGLYIGFLGSIIGLVLGHSLMEIMASFINFKYHYKFSGFVFDQFEIVLILITILIGMIAAIFPAVVAYKFDIAKVLKNKI